MSQRQKAKVWHRDRGLSSATSVPENRGGLSSHKRETLDSVSLPGQLKMLVLIKKDGSRLHMVQLSIVVLNDLEKSLLFPDDLLSGDGPCLPLRASFEDKHTQGL